MDEGLSENKTGYTLRLLVYINSRSWDQGSQFWSAPGGVQRDRVGGGKSGAVLFSFQFCPCASRFKIEAFKHLCFSRTRTLVTEKIHPLPWRCPKAGHCQTLAAMT